MAANSNISWTHHTVNFWIGCTKVSAACDNCYAERDWAMTGRLKRVEWGPHAARSLTKDPIAQCRSFAAKAAKNGRRERVSVNSLSDWADNHKSIPEDRRAAIFESAKMFPNLDFILLTKRPENMRRFLPPDWGNGYRNVWLGVSAENQETADHRVPILLSTPAAVRWASAEPMLGAIRLDDLDYAAYLDSHAKTPRPDPQSENWPRLRYDALRGHMKGPDDIGLPKLDWVVCGGESGPRARPMHPDWVRSIRDQCAAAGVAFHFKQWGEWAPEIDRDRDDPDWRLDYVGTYADRGNRRWLNLAGGQGYHGERFHVMRRVGTKAAGRRLDGQIHDAYPEIAT